MYPAKREYSFRVDTLALQGGLKFIQNCLPIRPGSTCTLKFDRHNFERRTCLYSIMGDINTEPAWGIQMCVWSSKYASHLSSNIYWLKAFDKGGEVQAGLASYFVKVHDGGATFNKMLDRVGEIASDQNLPGISFLSDDAELPVSTAKDNCDTLKREWSVIFVWVSILRVASQQSIYKWWWHYMCHCCWQILNIPKRSIVFYLQTKVMAKAKLDLSIGFTILYLTNAHPNTMPKS